MQIDRAYIYDVMMFVLMMVGLAGCSSGESPTLIDSYYCMELTFTLSVERNGYGATRTSGDGTWESGYDSDNITYDDDIDYEHLQVAVMDDKCNFVANVEELRCFQTSDNLYQYYGKVTLTDKRLSSGGSYRCMVVANVSSAIDFSKLATSLPTYGIASLPNSSSTDSYRVPMWGIRSFSFVGGEDTQVVGNIWLLKSAVKCRVRLSSSLRSAGYSLSNLQLHTYNSSGYVLPGNYGNVGTTTALSYDKSGDNYCFNPVVNNALSDDAIALNGEPGRSDGSVIAYFPEIINSALNPTYISLDITGSGGSSASYTISFKNYASDELFTNLVRNNVYDFEITGFSHDLEVNLSVAPWQTNSEEWDFTDQVSGDLDIDWNTQKCTAVDNEKYFVTLLSGVAAEGGFTISSPKGATWVATLGNSGSFEFVDESGTSLGSVATGDVDGNKITIRVKATAKSTAYQNESTLTIYVRFKDGTSILVPELSKWTIIQPV